MLGIIAFLAFVAMWWFCIQMAIYLVKPLFISPKSSKDDRLEIEEKDCPQLFSIIREVANATGNKMPKHVYLSPEVNACVFYDKVNIWSIFLPTEKDLMIGIGLLHGLNTSELKAILSHEFGHFAQQSMRIGTITYRLLLIIQTMMEYARQQQHKDVIARSQEDYKWYLHLAVYPISFITKRTIAFYNWIEKKNRSLRRFMEFEADSVACQVADAQSVISSLCKLEILSNRLSLYERLIANTLDGRQHLTEYWQGYVFVYEQLSRSENLFIEKDTLLQAPIGDNSKFPSRIAIVDGWNTHPTLSERIANAQQFFSAGMKEPCTDSPCDLVGIEILNKVGEMHQHYIAEHLQSPVSWESLTDISLKAFEDSFLDTYKEQLGHFFLSVFLHKRIHSFAFPDDQELEAESVANPFTEANRDTILQYEQGVKDWQVLNQINDGETDVKCFSFDNELYSDAKKPLEIQDEYLRPIHERRCALDVEIYKFLWKNTTDKQRLKTVYWTIMYANDAKDAFGQTGQKAEEIRNGLIFYHSNGGNVSISDEWRNALAIRLWKFLQAFNFDATSNLFGHIELDGTPLNEVMAKWKRFSLMKQPPFLSDADLINTIGEVSAFLDYMFNSGNNLWREMIIQTYDLHRHEIATTSSNAG